MRLMRVALILSICLMALSSGVVSIAGIQSAPADSRLSLSDSDKAEIIRLIIEERLKVDGEEKFKEYLVLASDNIKPSMVPQIRDFQIKLARTKDLERKAQKTPGGLKWMVFAEFKTKDTHVEVSFVRKHMSPGKPPLVPPLIRGASYRCFFRLVSGKWQGSCPFVIC